MIVFLNLPHSWTEFLKNQNFYIFQPILKIFSDIERTWSGVENIQSSSGFPILVEDKFYAFLTERVLTDQHTKVLTHQNPSPDIEKL